MQGRKIPWRRSEWERARKERPFGQTFVGLVILVFSFLVLFHGPITRQVLVSFDETFAGGAPKAKPAMASRPRGAHAGVDQLRQLLGTIGNEVRRQNWSRAEALLQRLEEGWGSAEPAFARAGVDTKDLNALTADVSELALAVAAHDSGDALAQVTQAERQLDWIATNYLESSPPTMAQMAAVIADLNQAVAKADWAKVRSDARILSRMMAAVEKGF